VTHPNSAKPARRLSGSGLQRNDRLGRLIGSIAKPNPRRTQGVYRLPQELPDALDGDGFLKIGACDISTGTSSRTDANPANLKMFEREDWTLFRTVEGLQQKAGVPATRLRRLVLKELFIDADTYFIEDDGAGLDGTPEQIAELLSIRRPMRSSKLLRLPQRGEDRIRELFESDPEREWRDLIKKTANDLSEAQP
jgi:hypothetical protein